MRGKRLILLGLVLAISGCPATGEEDLRKGNVFFANQDYEQAEAHYQQALKTAPESVRAMEALGNVAYERDDHGAAIDWYKKAVAQSEGAIGARHKLAVALATNGEVGAAIAVLEETIKLAPDDAFAFNALGGLYQKKGQLERAEAMQVKALAVDERYNPARYALAMLMIDAGRTEEAERELTKLVKNGGEGFAEYGFARIAAKAGRPELAAKHLSRVFDTNVARPEKILDDPAFKDAWKDPAMQALRVKFGGTSTTTP